MRIGLLVKFAIALLTALAWVPAPALVAEAPAVIRQFVKPFIKHPQVLSGDEIDRLANLASKTGGTKELGRILGSMKLPEAVLEDTYLRIAVQQSKISWREADGMMNRLRGTPGFRSTLSKVIGASEVGTTGHLNELQIADKAAEVGFRVRGIGVSFKDPNKQGLTDIDVILERKGKIFAIEAKKYRPDTLLPMDMVRADMGTLEEYAKANGSSRVVKVLSITNKPADELSQKLLPKEAERRGIELMYGSPEELLIQITKLEKLL